MEDDDVYEMKISCHFILSYHNALSGAGAGRLRLRAL